MSFHIPFLPLQEINARHREAISKGVERVVDSGWCLRGSETHAFEEAFANYVGTRHCISVANGLDALTLIFRALKSLNGWKDGDEVIVPAFTFIASAEAISLAGLKPAFCDVNADALLHPDKLEACITPRTRAIMAVHLYGKLCNMEAIAQIAATHKLEVIEDAAQAHGASSGNLKAGNALSVAAGFSFYPGKNLGALGDAGAITTNNESLARHVRMLANYGAQKKYEHEALGINSRMDEIQAAILSAKLTMLDTDNAHRRMIARIYSEGIKHPLIKLPYTGDTTASVFHIYPILTECRSNLQAYLESKGIETLIHYPLPLHRQVAYAEYSHQIHPMAENFAGCELSLPISPIMTPSEAAYVVETLNHFIQ